MEVILPFRFWLNCHKLSPWCVLGPDLFRLCHHFCSLVLGFSVCQQRSQVLGQWLIKNKFSTDNHFSLKQQCKGNLIIKFYITPLFCFLHCYYYLTLEVFFFLSRYFYVNKTPVPFRVEKSEAMVVIQGCIR